MQRYVECVSETSMFTETALYDQTWEQSEENKPSFQCDKNNRLNICHRLRIYLRCSTLRLLGGRRGYGATNRRSMGIEHPHQELQNRNYEQNVSRRFSLSKTKRIAKQQFIQKLMNCTWMHQSIHKCLKEALLLMEVYWTPVTRLWQFYTYDWKQYIINTKNTKHILGASLCGWT